jgi:hypothetical protein
MWRENDDLAGREVDMVQQDVNMPYMEKERLMGLAEEHERYKAYLLNQNMIKIKAREAKMERI